MKSEPTANGSTVIATHGGGKLVLQNIVGGDDIIRIGGEGNNYNLDGEQLPTRSGEDDGYWGRVEISPRVGQKTDTLLNVLYATDKDNDTISGATRIDGDGIIGALIEGICAVFCEEQDRKSAISLEIPTDANLTYYVSGVGAGQWRVSVDSLSLTVNATEESGLLRFNAPSGKVRIEPVN